MVQPLTDTAAGTVVDRPSGATRILVVEDDSSYSEALEIWLRSEGFAVAVAPNGVEALERVAADPPDLVLLDLMLPGMAGLEVCRKIRETSSVPIIVLSALASEHDTIVGLEVGATDYITKPFRSHELVARIRAVLRRVALAPGYATSPGSISAGPVRVDLRRREVSVDERPVYLPRREFELLVCLLTPPGQVHTRDDLIDRVWSQSELADSRTLDTHIRRLRMRLEADPANPQHIVTVRGVGFRFVP